MKAKSNQGGIWSVTAGGLFLVPLFALIFGATDNAKINSAVGAIRKGDTNSLERILADGMNANSRRGSDRQTLLMIAAWEGDSDIMTTLLRHGASTDMRDAKGKTAYDHAFQNRRTNVLNLLVAPGGK